MWTLPLPATTSDESFRTCIAKTRDVGLKQRLEAVAPQIAEDGVRYITEAGTATLRTIARHEAVGEVTGDELGNVYKRGMLPKRSAGRDIYESLLSAPPHGRCPLCGVGQVKTLDHHLPRSLYPAFAVNPANLVPACSDCNDAKRDHCPTCPDDESIHPYFDDVGVGTWLEATILEGPDAGARFHVARPAAWSETLFNRVTAQFKRLGLAELYAGNAVNELNEIRHQMLSLHQSGGAQLVTLELQARAESLAAFQPNSWRLALLRALAASDWYCGGGFRSR